MNSAIGKWISTTCCACFASSAALRSKGFVMLAALLRSFTALEFLKLHNCESQVLNRLRSPAISALVTDNRSDWESTSGIANSSDPAKDLSSSEDEVPSRTSPCTPTPKALIRLPPNYVD